MKTFYRRILLFTVAFGGLSLAAQAITYDFSVVYDINTQAQFNSVFGTGTAGFTTAGLYEETNTATKTVVQVGSGASSAPITLNTVFAQNSSPSNQLAFTSFGTNPSAIFPGSPLSNAPGVVPPAPTWQYVQTTSTTTASFVDKVGGVATPFSLDSIGLANPQSSNGSFSVTIEGFLGGSLVASQPFTIPGNVVGGNGNTGVPASVQIFTLTAPGFGDVDKIEVLPLGANVNVNDITTDSVAVPDGGSTLVLLGMGCGIMVLVRRSKLHVAR